jgi:hypothetical protein
MPAGSSRSAAEVGALDERGDAFGEVGLELVGAGLVDVTGGELLVDVGGGVGDEGVDDGLGVDAAGGGDVGDGGAGLDLGAELVFGDAEGIDDTDPAALARNPRVLEVVTAGVEQVMAGFNHAEQVKKFVVLADEWLPDSAELTPTSKLKRRNIAEKYAVEIASLYGAG